LRDRSGSGKSTLIALMLRFFDPTGGRLTLDGQDIRDFRLENYRHLISVCAAGESALHGNAAR